MHNTYWAQREIPAQVCPIVALIKVKFAVQFPCKITETYQPTRYWFCFFFFCEDLVRIQHLMTHTLFWVEGMCSLWQSRAAGGTAETLPVEVEALSTNPLHHINTPVAWVTLVTRLGKRPSHRVVLGNRAQAELWWQVWRWALLSHSSF